MSLDLTGKRACSVELCGKPSRSLGYCLAHYRRFKRHGSPTEGRRTPVHAVPVGRMTAPTEAFWARVDRTADCWNWLGARGEFGHGNFTYRDPANVRVRVGAHRYSWGLANGPIPAGRWVLHHCDNPRCVRPQHLFLGTHNDNMADMKRKGRGRRTGQTGSNNGRARLTQSQVLEIRDSGVSSSLLALRYGVTRSAIQRIRSRRSWRHL